MKLKEQTKSRVIIFSSILLFAFGIFNLSTNIYGEEHPDTPADLEAKTSDQFYQDLIEQFITITTPLLGSVIAMVLQYGRSKGLQISKDAEEYIIGATQSIVIGQSTKLFNKIYENKDLLVAYAAGKIRDEDMKKLKKELDDYKKEAKANALELLKTEIKSSKFKQTAKGMIGDNLEALIESTYTKNQSEKAERAKNLLTDLSGLAIDSALLHYDKKTLSEEDKNKIIKSGIDILAKNFSFEKIVLDVGTGKMHLEAALANKIDS